MGRRGRSLRFGLGADATRAAPSPSSEKRRPNIGYRLSVISSARS